MKAEKELETQSDSGLSNERGQGTVEFILVLVVVMAIALGSLYQFHDAFTKYVDNYFGNYLACLLETGELPNLGGTTNVGCDEDFEEFSLANGRPPTEAGVQTRAGGGGNDNNQNANAGQVRRGGNKFGSRRRARTPARAVNEGRSRKGSVSKKDSSSGDENNFNNRKNVDLYNYDKKGKRLKRVPAKKSEFGVADKKKKKQAKKKAEKKEAGSAKQKRNRIIAVKDVGAKPEEPDADMEFSLGKYLRYLIIAGIIIAIVVFIGGQALQLSKEWD